MMYQLVFRGECAPGTEVQAARSNAMALFKATVDQVDRMFSGQRVVIRNKLEEAQARKYQTVMRKHGMVAHLETMDGAAVETPAPSNSEPAQAPAAPAAAPASREHESAPPVSASTSTEDPVDETAPSEGSVPVEPGDRPHVAGERVDSILAGSSLKVSAAHDRLSERTETEAPLFEHLDDWTVAPPGAQLVEGREAMPVATPDISHLSLAEDEPAKS